MANPIKDFFVDGVIPTLTQLNASKPTKGVIAGVGSFLVPGPESVVLFRVIAHETAHGIEAKMGGAKVEEIDIGYNLFFISGTTKLNDTTEESALRSSLAGIGCDIGFLACSTILLKKISPGTALVFLVYDLISFFMGSDFAIYKIAKERIQVKTL